MMRMKALLLPFLLVGFSGALLAQNFTFDFTASGGQTVSGDFWTSAQTVSVPPAGTEYLVTAIGDTSVSGTASTSPSFNLSNPIALLPSGSVAQGVPDNYLLTTPTSTGPTIQGIGFSSGGYNYIVSNDGAGAYYLTQYTPGHSTYNFYDPVTFSATAAPWEPSDAIVLVGGLLFGIQQFRKRRKVSA